MKYLKDLFEAAKNAVASTVRNITNSFKKKAAETVMEHFGEEILEQGTKAATEKIKAAFNEFSTVNIFKALGIDKWFETDSDYEQKFDEMLRAGQAKLNELKDSEDPMVKGAFEVGSEFLKTMTGLKDECFKLKNKTIAQLKKEGLKAVEIVKPQLEKVLTDVFVNAFLGPFINFFTNLIKSLFSVNEPKVKAPAPAAEVKVEEAAEAQTEVEYKAPSLN